MLSDCDSCWDTPCTCGQIYKDASLETLQRIKNQLDQYIIAKSLQEFKDYIKPIIQEIMDEQ